MEINPDEDAKEVITRLVNKKIENLKENIETMLYNVYWEGYCNGCRYTREYLKEKENE